MGKFSCAKKSSTCYLDSMLIELMNHVVMIDMISTYGAMDSKHLGSCGC